jgi:uncharacterized membrane protein (DUF4010 family)
MELRSQIKTIEKELLAWHRTSQESRRLETIPGVGFITATAIAATVTDPSHFRSGDISGEVDEHGRAFSLKTAFFFAAMLSGVLLASTSLNEWFGATGVVVAAAVAGFVDTHSAAISVATLVGAGKMTATDAALPVLIALSTNTITKLVICIFAGGAGFALRVIPSLVLVILAAWGGTVFTRVLSF